MITTEQTEVPIMTIMQNTPRTMTIEVWCTQLKAVHFYEPDSIFLFFGDSIK